MWSDFRDIKRGPRKKERKQRWRGKEKRRKERVFKTFLSFFLAASSQSVALNPGLSEILGKCSTS